MASRSSWLALAHDVRGEGRGVRVSAHVEGGFLVLSTWKAGVCVSTVRLLPDEAAHLVGGLVDGLADLAGAAAAPTTPTPLRPVGPVRNSGSQVSVTPPP